MSPRVPGRGDGVDLNAVTEPDDCTHCSIVSGDKCGNPVWNSR